MFSSLRARFGAVKVTQESPYVLIDGVFVEELEFDIAKHWNSNAIAPNMFQRKRGGSFRIPQFYVIELLYILQQLIPKKRKRSKTSALLELAKQLRTNTWYAITQQPSSGFLNFNRLKELSWTPQPHQKEFIELYDKVLPQYGLKGYMLGASPGTGKTFMGLCISHMSEVQTTIIVSPKNAMKDVWQDTLEEVFLNAQSYWSSLNSTTPELGKRYYLVHYDALGKFLEFVQKHKKAFGRTMIVLDESHNMNESGNVSLRTETFLNVVVELHAEQVLWMSGTPIKAMGSEAIPFLKSIDPLFSAEVEASFRTIFGKNAKRGVEILSHRIGLTSYLIDKSVVVDNRAQYYKVTAQVKNGNEFTLPAIKKVMANFVTERMAYYQKNKERYHKDFFDAIAVYKRNLSGPGLAALNTYLATARLLHTSYDPMMHKAEPKYCNRFEKEYIMPALDPVMRAAFKEAKTVYKYYHLKVQGEALGRILGRERTRCNLAIAQSLDNWTWTKREGDEAISLLEIIRSSASKTVIFSSFVEVVDDLKAKLEARGIGALVVHGGTNKNLPAIIEQFKKDEGIEVLLATYQSLSTAVPLVMASNMVLMNQPFRDYIRNQATSRIDRLGQPHGVTFWDVYLDTGKEENISTRSKDILEWSKAQVAAIMGTSVPMDVEVSMEALTEPALLEEYLHSQQLALPEVSLISQEAVFTELKKPSAWLMW